MRLNPKEEIAFFELLRAGLWEKKIAILEPFPLSADEWILIFQYSCYQTVQGILFRGLSYLPSSYCPQEELIISWMVESVRIENNNEKTNKEIFNLCEFFRSSNIFPILKKGQAVAALYENPALRVCGDVDLYFPHKDDFIRSNQLLRDSGICMLKHLDGSYEYNWHGIQVEHHTTLIDLRNPFKKKYLCKLEAKKGYELLDFTTDLTTTVSVLSPSLNLLMLNTHIMKHTFLLGIGLRQLCDMARAYYRLYGKYDGEDLKKIYENVDLLKWSALLHGFLTTYLGLPKEYLPYREKRDTSSVLLFQTVIQGGNFGRYTSVRSKAERILVMRKMHTLKIIYRHRRIPLQYAPLEAFFQWIYTILRQI